jgi:hypothetical protein
MADTTSADAGYFSEAAVTRLFANTNLLKLWRALRRPALAAAT